MAQRGWPGGGPTRPTWVDPEAVKRMQALASDGGCERTAESGPLRAVHLSRHKWPTLRLRPCGRERAGEEEREGERGKERAREGEKGIEGALEGERELGWAGWSRYHSRPLVVGWEGCGHGSNLPNLPQHCSLSLPMEVEYPASGPLSAVHVQGYLAHKKTPTSLGLP